MTRRTSSPPATAAPAVDLTALEAALTAAFPDGRLYRVLETLLPTGVADLEQLQRATALSRDQLNRLLARLDELAPNALLVRVPADLPRPGKRGVPALFRLGEPGATLLRRAGHPDAQPCGLTEPTPLAHARATLEVRLAALAAGRPVLTETPLPYGDDRVLRPDNLVTLPNGRPALFETEQAADYTLLRRLRDSLRHKVEFFQSAAARPCSRTVRVLINLPPGQAWETTVAAWERATALVAEECGGDLPFTLVARPLYEFVAAPDWADPPDHRWESLFNPAQTRAFSGQPSAVSGQPAAVSHQPSASQRVSESTSQRGDAVAPLLPCPPAPLPAAPQRPTALMRRAPADDRRLLEAYWQHLLEQGPALACTADRPRADPEFFTLMGLIYEASHPEEATLWQQAQHPYASLYLLRQYLNLHPRLKAALKKTLEGRASRMTWNPTTILHRMQVVLDVFLRYHGLCRSAGLWVYPVSAWNRPDGSGDFQVAAELHPEVLMGERDGVVPLRDAVQAAERALAWVLYALFAYSEEVGLELKQGAAPFW